MGGDSNRHQTTGEQQALAEDGAAGERPDPKDEYPPGRSVPILPWPARPAGVESANELRVAPAQLVFEEGQ